MNRKPNILWIMTDQQSIHMLSCTGNKYVKTPNLDRLAAQSVRFENAYCTNPVCLPSRFSLFSGVYPGDIGIRSNECWNESTGVPQTLLNNGLGHLLREQGYEVKYGGKEHFPFVSMDALGLTSFTWDEREELMEKSVEILHQYDWQKPLFMTCSFINPHDICLMQITDVLEEDYPGDAFMEFHRRAIEEVHKAEQLPPGISRDEFFSSLCPPLPDNYMPPEGEAEAISLMFDQRYFKKSAREHYTDERWRLHRWAYAVLMEQVDAQIGKILDALEESGHWDDTLIIFTSDHGDMDASHKMGHKEILYQEACRVPLMIKGPGQKQENLNPLLISNGLDLIVTVMDYAGVTPPDYLRGRSLRPAVERGSTEPIHDIVILECENGIGAVSTEFKYVLYDKGARKEQFYDLRVNPGEMYNQIHDECYQDQVERFRKAVADHIAGRPADFICMKLVQP